MGEENIYQLQTSKKSDSGTDLVKKKTLVADETTPQELLSSRHSLVPYWVQINKADSFSKVYFM